MKALAAVLLVTVIAEAAAINCYVGTVQYVNGLLSGSLTPQSCPSTAISGTTYATTGVYCTKVVTGSASSYVITRGCSADQSGLAAACTSQRCQGSSDYQMSCCCNDRDTCNSTPAQNSIAALAMIVLTAGVARQFF